MDPLIISDAFDSEDSDDSSVSDDHSETDEHRHGLEDEELDLVWKTFFLSSCIMLMILSIHTAHSYIQGTFISYSHMTC